MSNLSQHYNMLGKLIVKPIGAQLARDSDFVGKGDPYVVVKVGSQHFHTVPANGAGKNPRWAETFTFKVDRETHMYVDVYDKDPAMDDHIGTCVIDLHQLTNNGVNREFPIGKPIAKISEALGHPNQKEHSVGVLILSTEFVAEGQQGGYGNYGAPGMQQGVPIAQNMQGQMPNLPMHMGYPYQPFSEPTYQQGYPPNQGYPLQQGYPPQQGYPVNNQFIPGQTVPQNPNVYGQTNPTGHVVHEETHITKEHHHHGKDRL